MGEQEYKRRVNFQVGRSINLTDDEFGSYMLFYLIGNNVKKVVEQVVSTIGDGIFDMQCASKLRELGIHVVVKAGTTANRKSRNRVTDPYNQRGREIISELGKCFQGIFEGADVATRTVHEILASNDTYHCHAIMVAHQTHSKLEYLIDIEKGISDHVESTYGICVANSVDNFNKVRNQSRWGSKEINIKF